MRLWIWCKQDCSRNDIQETTDVLHLPITYISSPMYVILHVRDLGVNWRILLRRIFKNNFGVCIELILHEKSKRKTNWIGHILCRNCLLRQVNEGKLKEGIEATGRRGRRRRKVLGDLKEMRGCCHLKEEALDRTM
jgi:hypothetical protein